MFNRLKIQTKISLTAAFMFALSFIVVISILLSQIYVNSKTQAENLVKATSLTYAKDISGRLNVLKSVATGLDSAVLNQLKAGYTNRNQIIELQKDILKKNPDIFGVTVAFEANSYDKQDAKYGKDTRFGNGGLFIPYVTRNGGGFNVQAAYDSTTDMTWYNVPKKTRKIYVTEPTTYKVSGKDVSMASLVTPLLDKSGRFLGVTSFDYALGTFQSQIKAVKTLGGGAFLISKSGMIIANGVDNTALMTNVSEENKTVWQSILAKTSVGKEISTYGVFTKDGDRSLLYAAPINLDGIQIDWSLINVVPDSSVFADFNSMLKIVISIALGILLLLIALMFIVSRVIAKGIQFAEGHLAKIALGDITADVDPRFLKKGDEVGNLCKTMQTITESLREKALTAEKISNGDINVTITEKSDKDILSQSMKKMVSAISGLIEEAAMLERAATEGDLCVRGNAEKFSGGYRQIIAGVNGTLDAVSEPLDEVRAIVSNISVNDYTKMVEGSYRGSFKALADDINSVRDKLLVIQDNMVQVSKGNCDRLGEVKKHGKRSENDNMTPAIIAMMENVGNLIREVERISAECVNGNVLSIHGNEDLFEGGFRQIIHGFNDTLDGISYPLNEIMHLLDAMAVNDFTQAVSDDYRGDYKKLGDAVKAVLTQLNAIQNVVIKISDGDVSRLEALRAAGRKSENDQMTPALIKMTEAVDNLITETTAIATSASEGNLSIRGDADKFSGGFATTVSAINALLDAVEAPVNDVKRVMSAIAESRLDERIEGDYKGEFQLLADTVNTTCGMLEAMILKISTVLTRISSGDLGLERIEQFDGDFAAISIALNGILDSLNELLGNISSTAEQVAAGSAQVAQGSSSLSQGATEQASSVQELTAAVTEIAGKTKQNAEDASAASQLVTAVAGSAADGSRNMDDMLTAMQGISDASANISKIIKVIDDIAFQTNILALNAAVEAARAGAAGKGFAVVADEVRNLAAKSADAAKETTALIEGSSAKVADGTQIAQKTAQALTGIVDGVGSVTALVKKISAASSEQATGIAQIDTGLSQVGQVIQTVSATAEQSAAASEELTSQADLLNKQIAGFILRK